MDQNKTKMEELNCKLRQTFINNEEPSKASISDVSNNMVIKGETIVPKKQKKGNIALEEKSSTKKKHTQSLSATSKERVVPSSRINRMVSFGGLAAGLGMNAVTDYVRAAVQTMRGREDDRETPDSFISTANAARIVDTLCKVRGAALKLGQLLSIQDENVMTPELHAIFERVRQSADYMPSWQVDKVMSSQFGTEWRNKLKSFEEKPFAAASIGQVHRATLPDGTEVAVKVQYPGVAQGITSDLDNLVAVLKVWKLFPKGMFIDNVVAVAKKELAHEVDYVREADWTRRFKTLLEPYPEYYVPKVIDELSAAEVITTELVEGVPLDQLADADHATRHRVASKMMLLVLREMFQLRCMQTDPNWANFLYNASTGQINLLDFGATREYSELFMDHYIETIRAAAQGDRATILRMSRQMGFLTGEESEIMKETHVQSVMIMGEVFTTRGEFDFSEQRTAQRVQSLAPTLVEHRLCAPPEEAYSLYRKLSGIFLLCCKLKVAVDCSRMFEDIYSRCKRAC